MRPRRVSLTLASAAFAALCVSCSELPRSLRDTGEAMDRLADVQAEFGTMAISAPVLARPDDRFQFTLDVPAKTLYDDAKTARQGRISVFEAGVAQCGSRG